MTDRAPPNPPSGTRRRLGPEPGSRIVVVGAGGGIGRALVAALLEEEARVAALDLPQSLGLVPDGTAGLFALDARAPDQVSDAFARAAAALGGIDAMVMLSGFTPTRTPASDIPPEVWSEVVEVNLNGTWLCARAAIPYLRKGRNPTILNTASGLAFKPSTGYGPYAAAKAGVVALTRNLAQENAPWLRVNALAPSAVDTPFLTGGTGRDPDVPQMNHDDYARAVPLGRLARPEDVVGPALFLLGPAAGYINGQCLHVNGGLFMP